MDLLELWLSVRFEIGEQVEKEDLVPEEANARLDSLVRELKARIQTRIQSREMAYQQNLREAERNYRERQREQREIQTERRREWRERQRDQREIERERREIEAQERERRRERGGTTCFYGGGVMQCF
jgi:hypothetical protein